MWPRILAVLLACAGIFCLSQQPRALTSAQMAVLFSGASYNGPANVVPGPFAAYMLRAASTADRGNRLINLCDPSNVTCADWNSDPSTGMLVASTNPLNGTDCTVTAACTIKIWYDRSGATNCGGSACDAAQATAASRPTLTWHCINNLPCVVFSGIQFLQTSANLSAFSATATFSAIANRTSGFTTSEMILSIGSASGVGLNLNFRQVANTIQVFAGTAGIVVGNITDSNFHILQAAFNGASSELMCGGTAGTNCSAAGTDNSVSPGTTGSGASSILCIGIQSGTATCSGNLLAGDISEALIYTSAFSGTQRTNMTANQYKFWGAF